MPSWVRVGVWFILCDPVLDVVAMIKVSLSLCEGRGTGGVTIVSIILGYYEVMFIP